MSAIDLPFIWGRTPISGIKPSVVTGSKEFVSHARGYIGTDDFAKRDCTSRWYIKNPVAFSRLVKLSLDAISIG